MKVLIQSIIALIIAQILAVFEPPFLQYYYALLVASMITLGLRTGCPWYTRITLLLFLGYIAENNAYLWNVDASAMALVHLVLGASIFNYCKTSMSKAHIYLSGILGLKALCDILQYSGIIIPSIYIYHAAINFLSVVGLIWFMNLSVRRHRLIINGVKGIDPILLKIALCISQIKTTLYGTTGKGSPQ